MYDPAVAAQHAQEFVGGKRARDDDKAESAKNRIHEVIGDVHELPADSQAVKNALGEVVDIEAWINELSLKNVEKLKDLTLKHETRGNTDFVLLQYAQYLPALTAVEANYISLFFVKTSYHTHVCDFHTPLCD